MQCDLWIKWRRKLEYILEQGAKNDLFFHLVVKIDIETRKQIYSLFSLCPQSLTEFLV